MQARTDNGDASVPDDRFHYTVFTLPYDTDAQPIERLWSYAKQYAAAQHTAGRTLAGVRQHLLCGFYGDGKSHPAVSAEHCQRWINAAHDHLSTRLRSVPSLRALFGGAADTAVRIESLTPAMCAEHKRLNPVRYDLLEDGAVYDDEGHSDDDDSAPAAAAAAASAAAAALAASSASAAPAAAAASSSAARSAAPARPSAAAAAASAQPKRRAAPHTNHKRSAKSK